MQSDVIKVASNFISKKDVAFYVNLINKYEESNLADFYPAQGGKRLTLSFGNYENDVKFDPRVQETLALFSEEELNKIRNLFLDILKQIKNTYKSDDSLYVCSFFLAKQYPGAEVMLHTDIEGETNNHFEHSVLLYLNTLEVGGELEFVSLNYAHKPKEGDLLFFSSRGSGPHCVRKIPEERYSLVLWTTKDKKFELK